MKKTTVKELTESDSPRIKLLRNEIKSLQKQRSKLQEKLESRKEFADQCAAAVVAADPFPQFNYTGVIKQGKPVVAVLKLSDWHIGEVVQARETEGFNAYNFAIAQQRIFSVVTDFLKWVQVHRQAHLIEECRIFGEGDYVSGDIHTELLRTNEFPLPEQSVKAGLLLGEVIRRVAGHFKRVHVEAVGADNHGRLTVKPQAKQKTSNNMSFVVHAIAVSSTQQCDNVFWHEATGAKQLATVNGFKFLIEHGDAIRGNMGIPYYGFQRLIGKEAVRRMNTQRGFDYLSIGHFHVPALIEGRTIVNGSLSGTSEFDHVQGRHAKPAQVAFFVHQRHGIFNLTPFKG